MKLQELFAKLQNLKELKSPIAVQIDKNDQFTMLALGFKKGTVLPNHSTARDSRLLVIKGAVEYKENDTKTTDLPELAYFEIPLHTTHQLKGMQDSICLLLQTNS